MTESKLISYSKSKHSKTLDIPMFLTELTLSYSVRIELEKAFAHYVATKQIEINSDAYMEIQLADLIPSLR